MLERRSPELNLSTVQMGPILRAIRIVFQTEFPKHRIFLPRKLRERPPLIRSPLDKCTRSLKLFTRPNVASIFHV